MNYLQRLVSKLFRLGPAVIEPADIAFGTDPERWSPEVYGNYIATSSAVYACVNLRARSLAGLPMLLHRDGQDVAEGQLFDLLHTVNPWWTTNRLLQMTLMALDLWGEAYWVLERGPDGQGVPREIWWARPDRMRLVPDVDNYLGGWIYEWNNQRLAFRPDEVIWFRNPNPLDEFEGLSPIAATRLALDTGHAALRSNHNVFSNGVQLAGVVTPADKDSTWARDQVEALRDMLEKRFKGVDKAHRLAVLGQAATFTPMGISPRDAQFIELMKWTRTDACMVYGVPPELVGDQEGATYNNVREAHKGFWTDTMIPLSDFLAQEITEQLLPMFPGEAERLSFDLSGVLALQSDMKETAEQARLWAAIGVPLNRILSELAPQFLNDGDGWEWGDQPPNVQGAPPVTAGFKYAEYPGLRFIAPQAVRDAARKGLRLYEEGRGGDGLTSQTVREARTIAGRQDVSPDKLRRMRAWFARHESDKKPGWDKPGQETPGYVAWLLWGGDPGRRWAEQMVEDMERIDTERQERAVKAMVKPIELGSVEHKQAYEEFGRRADRIMGSFQREVSRLMREQGEVLAQKLAEQAVKAVEDETDVDAIWDEVFWQTLFADALLDQIQTAAELGAVSTLQQLEVSTALFNLESPEVAAAMQARAQAFAVQVNETTWDALKASLMQGIADGESIEQLMPRVSQVMGDRIRSSAETIARTETIGALTEGSLMGAKEAEATGLDVKKQWLASFDGRERETHAAAHRRYQRGPIGLTESFTVGGVEFQSPGNPTGGRGKASAAETINCRCAMTYVVEDDTTQAGVLQSDIAARIQGWLNDSRQG
jgi:HK97 family phage portal protein